MLKYEDIVAKLNDAIVNANLDSYLVREKIELRSCNREYINICKTKDAKDGKIRAEISFEWDSLLTTESVYGGNCSLYHDETEPCLHDELEPNPFIELEINYYFDIGDIELIDIEKVLSNVFDGTLEHNNRPLLRWSVLAGLDNNKKISKVYASYYWHIDLNEDEEIDFDGICIEIYQVLKALESLFLSEAARDVNTMLHNPVYAFGRYFETPEEISEWVTAFNHSVAGDFWNISIDKQVKAFQEFFNWLVDNEYVEEVGVAETIIKMDEWLKVQKKNAGEILRLVDASLEAKKEFVKVFLEVATAKELF